MEVDYEIREDVFETGYTFGDRIIETWKFWNTTGQYPWPDAFNEAVSVDVEELSKLEESYQSWRKILNA